ncbi:hypothetical protein P692DRAFT_20739725 [Suillus brevipes Sb2]|nr:hypothetical protein P692DRAFT_20739725 [Suillus brevipes Sb2]
MRFSAMNLVVVIALALSISATPIDTGTEGCPSFCTSDSQCTQSSGCTKVICVSLSCLYFEFDDLAHQH